MATKLSAITTQYRSFVDDQVLTASQLNTLIDYFQDQGRLSRILMNGVGIVCGFRLSINASKEIVVSQGAGVTTDGDLIQLQKPVQGSDSQSLDCQQIKFTHYKIYEGVEVNYIPFHKNETLLTIYELIPESPEPKTDFQPLNTLSGVEKMIALLYLEEFQKAPELCTAIDCNNQGIEEISRLKVLLVSENDATYIKTTDPIYSKQAIVPAYLQLPEIGVQRVVLTSNAAASQANLLKSFHTAIASNNTVSQLKTAVGSLFANLAGFLSLPSNITANAINQLIDNLLGFSAMAIPVDAQYRYDLLKDLVDTYSEIREILPELEAECCPNVNSFAKHLFIGRLTPMPNAEPFRHSFYHSPVSGKNYQNIDRLNSLLTRFYLMLNNYSFTAAEVKITPSKNNVSLSCRSIPFYYTITDQLIDVWDFNKTKRFAQKTNLAYDRTKLAPAGHIQNPLNFGLDNYDLLRIEGHLNKSSVVAEPQLTGIQTANSLDFDYTAFDIDTNQTDLQQFIKKNNSLEHLSGVPKGGTFVVLKKANLIIADFALGYKYRNEQSEFCCKISECSYPWISSLKYLNNLSRSLRGTQSTKQLMPKNYRLLVMQYSINGVSLIGQPTEVSVPLSEVFNGRVHAIMRKLNERFPTGLVFDYDQDSKLLKVKKLKDDTFVLMLRDITMGNTAPVYTLTEKAFLKNGRALQSKAVVCTDVTLHQANVYRQIHTKYEPVNKDDDYGRYDDKWKRWAELTENLMHNPLFREIGAKRFPLKISELPKEVQEELRAVKADILQTNANAKACLSGDWTNGTWVNNTMLTYYNAHRKNTHDDIVVFMKLRESLHQKTGKSKYSIFVDGINDVQLKTLQTKYLNKVDFYMMKSEGVVIVL